MWCCVFKETQMCYPEHVTLSVSLLTSAINYCMSDVYEVPHGDLGSDLAPGPEEYCVYPAQEPGFRLCEPQALQQQPPLCLEQEVWPASPHLSAYL